MGIPYPNPDPATSQWDPFALKQNLLYLDRKLTPSGGLGIIGSYTSATLPTAGSAGRLARVSDGTRGLWMDTGTQWFSLSGGWANVREFGAKGNGTTDDLAAFNAAVTALGATGGIVFVPPGTYKVIGTITMASKVMLLGAGWASIIKQYGDTNTIYGSNVTDCAVCHLQIMGDGTTTNVNSLGVRFSQGQRIQVSNCYIHDFCYNGIFFENTSLDNFITDNYLSAIDLDENSVGTAIVATFDGNASASTGSGRVVVDHNIIRDTYSIGILVDSGTGSGSAGAGDSGFTVDVTDNIISSTTNGGIWIGGALNVSISGNTLVGIGTRSPSDIAGMSGIRVERDNNPDHSIASRLSIVGNTLVSIRNSGIKIVDEVNSFTVVGNVIYDAGYDATNGHGLEITTGVGTGVKYGLIADNAIVKVGGTGNMTNGINLAGSNAGLAILHNLIQGQSGDALAITGTAVHYLWGNVDLSGAEVMPTGPCGVKPSVTSVTGTVNETDLGSYTLKANHLGPTGKLRIRAAGTGTGTAGTKNVKLYLGTASFTMVSFGSGSALDAWTFDAEIDNTSTSAQRWDFRGFTLTGSTTGLNIVNYGTSSQDTSSSKTVKVTGQLGNSGDTITLTKFVIEVLRQ